MDEELEHFKTHINLSEYTASLGYQWVKSESSRNSAVMQHPTSHDKVIIARGHDNHWTYFSVRDTADNGSIIDFVQKRESMTLGYVRKRLRPWIGSRSAPTPINEFAKKIVPVAKNREGVVVSYSQATPIQTSEYLQSRGILSDTIKDPRFAAMIRQDVRGNTLFPHYDRDGLSGYEIKNHQFTGFARGGFKSVWHSRIKATDNKLVLVESAIDALSYHQIKGDPNTRYISTAGQLSDHQKTVIKSAINKMPEHSLIVGAFDQDKSGQAYYDEIKHACRSGTKITRDAPSIGKDWNDQLKSAARNRAQQMGFERQLELSR